MPNFDSHELYCDICMEVVYTFEGYCDPHDGAESTCPGCGARGHVYIDMDEGQMYVRCYAFKGEWKRIQQEEEFARIVLEMGYDSWKELFYAA